MSSIQLAKPNLRIFAELDTDVLSNEFKEKVGHEEGAYDAVDLGRARDLPWTEEIQDAMRAFILVDEAGASLARFATLESAERARGSAKITFNVEVDTTEAPAKAAKA